MHGNVSEWVQDCWNGSYRGAPADGSAWQSGDCSRRVFCGGNWDEGSWGLRSAYRYRVPTGYRSNTFGFRVARTITRFHQRLLPPGLCAAIPSAKIAGSKSSEGAREGRRGKVRLSHLGLAVRAGHE